MFLIRAPQNTFEIIRPKPMKIKAKRKLLILFKLKNSGLVNSSTFVSNSLYLGSDKVVY